MCICKILRFLIIQRIKKSRIQFPFIKWGPLIQLFNFKSIRLCMLFGEFILFIYGSSSFHFSWDTCHSFWMGVDAGFSAICPKMKTLIFNWIFSNSFRHYWDKVILVNKHLPFLVVSFFTLWLFFWRDEATFISTLIRFIYPFLSSVSV